MNECKKDAKIALYIIFWQFILQLLLRNKCFLIKTSISTFLSMLLYNRIFLLNSINKINASVWSLSVAFVWEKALSLVIARMWFKRQWPYFIIPLQTINGITFLHHSIGSLNFKVSTTPCCINAIFPPSWILI